MGDSSKFNFLNNQTTMLWSCQIEIELCKFCDSENVENEKHSIYILSANIWKLWNYIL